MQKPIVEHVLTQGSPKQTTRSVGRRFHELDSIRGLASLTVVLLHFHEIWMPDDPMLLSRGQHIALSILKPFYSGSQAVILFFLLSGLVLSLPYLHGKEQPYWKYLLRRTIRVYGPYLATIALSIAAYSIWKNHAYHGAWAQEQWAQPLTAQILLQHILFIGVYDWRQLNFVIWTLIQEMRISIVFPLLILLVKRIGSRASILLGCVLSAVSLLFLPQVPDISAQYSLGITVHYVAFFLVGIVMATQLGAIEHKWSQLSSTARVLTAIVSLVTYVYAGSIATIVLRVLHHGHLPSLTAILILASWFIATGAIGLMIVGLHAVRVRRILNAAPSQFLGKISYSLYLVHPMVLFAVTFSCAASISMVVQFPLYLFAAILVAWLFNLAVERPFIRLSRSI